MKHTLPIILAALCTAVSANAAAFDGVVVTPSGGTMSVRALDLERGPEDAQSVVDLGARRVLPADVGLQVLNDVKVLPDGSHLVSGGDGLGLIVTDENGDELIALSRQSSFGAVASASVGAYFSGAEPSRVVIASDTVAAAFSRQISSERLLFFESTRLGESRGRHAEVVVLPGNAVAVAANFPANGLSTLDVISFADGTRTVRRFSNGENLDHPADTTIDESFTDLRDIHGFGGDTPGDLLVVTRTQVFRLAEDGTQSWSLGLGDLGLGGEFASGVVLPSGRIALATFEPGRWVDPHPNHRVAWLEADGTFSGLVSGPLEAAPVSIDALESHGGTGTTGFTAGLADLSLGNPEDLQLAGPIALNRASFALGSSITARAIITYPGTSAVSLGRVRLVAAPSSGATCEGVDVPVVAFARDDAVTILAGESYPIDGTLAVDSVFDFGAWCAWVEIADTAGRVVRLGDYATFDVVEQGGDAGGEPIPSNPIGFDGNGADAGTDAGDASDAGGTGSEEGGCGCGTARGFDASGLALILLAVGLAVRRRGRS